MARTWATRPVWVKLRDGRTPRTARHAHEHGDCDLAVFERTPGARTRCSWGIAHPWLPLFAAPPSWCVDRVWNNPERVHIRDRLRSFRGAQVADRLDQLDGYDLPCHQPRGSAYAAYW